MKEIKIFKELEIFTASKTISFSHGPLYSILRRIYFPIQNYINPIKNEAPRKLIVSFEYKTTVDSFIDDCAMSGMWSK